MSKRIDLNGAWQLRWNDGQRGGDINRVISPRFDPSQAIQAQVPGEIHLDLIRAGLLQEPTTGLNCLAARWVEETLWFYRRTFTAPALLPGERAILVFEGLDLTAVVYLNGQEVGRHANAFYPCSLDVTAQLQAGENLLVVALDSGLFSVSEKPSDGFGMSLDSKLHKRNWLRKTQSSFGWDWSPRLVNVGIFGNVYLEICASARFDRLVVLSKLSPDFHQGTVTGRVFVEGLANETQKGILTVEIEGTGQTLASVQKLQTTTEVAILPGINPVETQVSLEDPQLWWPVHHGRQPLYTVKAVLSIAGQVIGADSRQVGFRQVRIDQSPHPDGGSYFILEVNGKPIFAKGGNFVPADSIFARLVRARYAALVDRALEANFNLLRIWGGGLYESDDLYELCDQKGLLVWQEFIFACAKYPAYDECFLADIKREAAYQVRRLAHHPSLVVWCGNNEMEWGNFNWGYEKGVAHSDYAVFHMVLPVILKQEDGTRYYQPSSPYSPNLEAPNRDDMGDQHPWSIGFFDTDFRKYRTMTSRFPNEGGILGPTALPTVKACLPDGHQRPGSFAWQIHDNGIAFLGDHCQTDEMLVQWLGKPIEAMTIEDYVYYGGVVQGEGLAEYIRNFRRRMFNTASAIFWMYNDCWPVVRSWTIVDYYLRRTPAFHPVRRAFQPLSVAVVHENGKVQVYGVNEGSAWQGQLRCGLFALAGGYPLDMHQEVAIPANTSTRLAEFPAEEWTRLGEKTHAAFAILSQDGEETAQDSLFLPFYKEMEWPKAEVRVQRKHGKAIFESDAFAWRVCLDLDGEIALPDNFFDILPGIPKVLDWPEALGEPKILRTGNL